MLLCGRTLLAVAASGGPRAAPPMACVETKKPVIALLGKLLPSQDSMPKANPLDEIDWSAAKASGLSTAEMAARLDSGLREREWFVTGRGLPQLFSEKLKFSDPDVKVDGIEPYCRQVRRLFDQETARCEVICCTATAENTVTIAWLNSGKVNLGPLGFQLKPYVVTTTMKTDPSDGLIISQEDTFDINVLELLIYQIPFLRPFAGPSAPSIEELRASCDPKTCRIKS